MHYTLQEGKQSNYQAMISVTIDELAQHKDAALKQFQKDLNVEGFRPGHAPLSMVEQRVSPEYVKVAMYEEALHTATSVILAEHPEKKFIGQMYNLSIDDSTPEVITLSFIIDVYPEIKENSSDWKKIKMSQATKEASDAEIEETILNLKKQYADYQNADSVSENSVFKVSLSFLDADKQEVNTGKLYLGKEDFEEFPQLKEYFIGKTSADQIVISYDEKKLPHTMHLHKEGLEAKTIQASITDIKDVSLPEFTPENIKKFFGNDEIKTEEELRTKIATLVATQKEETSLMQAVDSFLQEAMKSFDCSIPKTLIDEEVKTRNKSLQEKMGGEEGLKKYFAQIGEEEVAKLHENISTAAKSSLEKFLILKAIVESLGLSDINREAHLDVEKKLYAAMTK